MDVVNETNKIILKRMTKKIFTDEQEGKGNALRAVKLLIKDGHITKEDLECLAHIMEHWYGKNEQMTWEDLMALPEGTTAKEAVDSIMQKFVIESELKGIRLKVPAVNVLGALLHMDIKAAGIGGSWGKEEKEYPGSTTLQMANKIVTAEAESATKLKAAEAMKPVPVKAIPTDKVTLFNGTAGMCAPYVDQSLQAFAAVGLSFLLATEPDPNRPIREATPNQQASGFNFLRQTMSKSAMDVDEVERAAADPNTTFRTTWNLVVTSLVETENGKAEAADAATKSIRDLHSWKLPTSGTLSELANKMTTVQRQLIIVGKGLTDGEKVVILSSALKEFSNFTETIRAAASTKGTDRQLSYKELLNQLVNIERLDDARAKAKTANDILFAAMREEARAAGRKEGETAAIQSFQQTNSGSPHNSGRGKPSGKGGDRKPQAGEEPHWKKAKREREETREFQSGFDYLAPTRLQQDGTCPKKLGGQVSALNERQLATVRKLVKEVEEKHADDLRARRAQNSYFEAIITIWKGAVSAASGSN